MSARLPVMTPSLESLRCFHAAATALSFRVAARKVALSPTAFSQRIKQLEDQLGTALFVRTTRVVHLTADGRRLMPLAERAIAAAEACARLSGPDPADRFELTLGTRHELGMSWIFPMAPALERAIPGLRLHLYFGASGDLVARLRTLEIDVAVTSARLADPSLEALPLHREDYVLVASPRLLAGAVKPRTPDLGAFTLLDISADAPLFRYFRDAPGAPPAPRFGDARWLGTIAAIRAAALDARGVAVLPRYLVADDLGKRRLVPLWTKVEPLADFFRLVFRTRDPRRDTFERLAAEMRGRALR